MRIANVECQGRTCIAIDHGGRYFRWEEVLGGAAPASMVQLLGSLARGQVGAPQFEGVTPLPEPCRLLAPFIPPRNVICIGKNYAEHAAEFTTFTGGEVIRETEPVVFTKSPSSICDPDSDVLVRAEQGAMLDYEVELAVVIGTDGYRIAAGDAAHHIAGYSIINDLTARDAQLRHPQWFLAKSLRSASAFGPVLVTPDELPDDPRLTTEVDGETRQDARVSQMLRGVPELIEYISGYVALAPGDVIATGTPSGVGIGFEPPRFITDGLTVTCAIEGIGRLVNRFTISSPEEPPAVGAGADAEALL